MPTSGLELAAEVTGGTLSGFGSGNPCTDENYGTGKRRVWNGLALACLRAPEQVGEICLTLRAEGLPEAALTIQCQ